MGRSGESKHHRKIVFNHPAVEMVSHFLGFKGTYRGNTPPGLAVRINTKKAKSPGMARPCPIIGISPKLTDGTGGAPTKRISE